MSARKRSRVVSVDGRRFAAGWRLAGKTGFEAAWVGELEAPEDLPLRRPGKSPNWRVTIEEWERLPGDPANLGFFTSIGFGPPPPIWEQRLIYAEEIAL